MGSPASIRRAQAARAAGVDRSNFRRLLKQYEVGGRSMKKGEGMDDERGQQRAARDGERPPRQLRGLARRRLLVGQQPRGVRGSRVGDLRGARLGDDQRDVVGRPANEREAEHRGRGLLGRERRREAADLLVGDLAREAIAAEQEHVAYRYRKWPFEIDIDVGVRTHRAGDDVFWRGVIGLLA